MSRWNKTSPMQITSKCLLDKCHAPWTRLSCVKCSRSSAECIRSMCYEINRQAWVKVSVGSDYVLGRLHYAPTNIYWINYSLIKISLNGGCLFSPHVGHFSSYHVYFILIRLKFGPKLFSRSYSFHSTPSAHAIIIIAIIIIKRFIALFMAKQTNPKKICVVQQREKKSSINIEYWKAFFVFACPPPFYSCPRSTQIVKLSIKIRFFFSSSHKNFIDFFFFTRVEIEETYLNNRAFRTLRGGLTIGRQTRSVHNAVKRDYFLFYSWIRSKFSNQILFFS